MWKWKYNVFYLPSDHDAEVSRDIVGGVPFILRHHPAKFGLHRPCESADTTFFDLSRDHAIDVPHDFVGEFPSS